MLLTSLTSPTRLSNLPGCVYTSTHCFRLSSNFFSASVAGSNLPPRYVGGIEIEKDVAKSRDSLTFKLGNGLGG